MKRKKPPKGFDVIAYRLEVLDSEMRDKVKESNQGKRNTESVWPVHQINYQRTRYVYDMYTKYKKISRKVYDYCIKNKMIDANLIAKWKKPGYEKLCSTYVINPANYKFGTTSICRVPFKDRNEMQLNAQDPTTGCCGCFSGPESLDNIFKGQYGQDLARIQVEREFQKQKEAEKERQEELLQIQREEEAKAAAATSAANQNDDAGDSETDDDAGESETDDESSDDDYGPSPQLQTDDRPAKKARAN